MTKSRTIFLKKIKEFINGTYGMLNIEAGRILVLF